MIGSPPPAPAPRVNLCPACDIDLDPGAATCPQCGAPAVSIRAGLDPNLDRVLDGRYQLRTLLGAGGMGTVYRAWQDSVKRDVAVKLIHERYRRDLVWIRRFLREARLASRLHHPHTVGILDFGQTEEGDLFLAMELLHGRTLAEVMAADGPFDLQRTVRIGVQICDALSAACDRQIVHRDLKPQNIMILDEPAGRDFVKLLDFGLARFLGDEVEESQSSQLIGTPYYMAPEVIARQPPSAASDLYALGVILCEAHLGRRLFTSDSFVPLHLEKAGLIDVPPDVHPRLRAALRDLIEPNPARRPHMAAEVRARLEQCAAGRAAADGGTAGHRTQSAADAAGDGGPALDVARERPERPDRLADEPMTAPIVDAITQPAPPVNARSRTLPPPPRRARRTLAVAAAVAAAATAWWAISILSTEQVPIGVLASVPVAREDPAAPAPVEAAAPARPAFWCGPHLHTYAVEPEHRGGGDRGVRCVKVARDAGGGTWLAWYGEGIRDGLRYRLAGEGRLGGTARSADLIGNGEQSDRHFDGTLTLRAEPASTATADAPQRILICGAATETWVRITGFHADYTSVFSEPVRTCGPHLERYRAFHTTDGVDGVSVRCALPGARTWIGSGQFEGERHLHLGTMDIEGGRAAPVVADICADPAWTCYAAPRGKLTRRPVAFPGIGAGFEFGGIWPELWLPMSRRHAVRIHAVRVRDQDGTDAGRLTAAQVRAWVERANQLLAPASLEVYFIGDERGPDFETMDESATGGAKDDERLWARYGDGIALQHTTKILVFFRAGTSACAPSTSHEFIAMSPLDDPRCATPLEDRLGHAIARHVGLDDVAAPLTPAQEQRLQQWLRARRRE